MPSIIFRVFAQAIDRVRKDVEESVVHLLVRSDYMIKGLILPKMAAPREQFVDAVS